METRFQPVFDAQALRFIRADYSVQFLNTIEEPNRESPVVTSDAFVYKGKVATIRNKIGNRFSTDLEIVDTDGNVLVTNAGYYEPSEGKVTLTAFTPSSIVSGSTKVKIIAIPADDADIKPLRNHVIDLSTNIVSAETDTNLAQGNVGTTN